MSISAMKQAVKALEFAAGLISPITKGCQCQICLAHKALRQAIDQAEKQEPAIPAAVINAIRNYGLTLIKTQQGYVLQRIEGVKAQPAPIHASDISAERVDETAKDKHEKQEGWVLREVYFSEGEPVSHREPQAGQPWVKSYCGGKANYTTPAEEWAMQQMVAENQRLGLYDDTTPTCQENRQVELKNALELQEVVKQFFERFLNRVEDSEQGKPFNPVIVSCCRALMIQPLSDILERMRVLSGAKSNPLYEENKNA